MKIKIAFAPDEEASAAEVVKILKQILPLKIKKTPEKDGYLHIYLSTKLRK